MDINNMMSRKDLSEVMSFKSKVLFSPLQGPNHAILALIFYFEL
jgi:hypothetical protein